MKSLVMQLIEFFILGFLIAANLVLWGGLLCGVVYVVCGVILHFIDKTDEKSMIKDTQ